MNHRHSILRNRSIECLWINQLFQQSCIYIRILCGTFDVGSIDSFVLSCVQCR